MNYYNDFDPKAAAFLKQFIKDGIIPLGDVDDRPIEEVQSHELKSYTQCHFFAGIGGWPYALQLAGWPADRPVWTGSCPCQPFSSAGKRLGKKDPRHLWPQWARLIRESAPSVVFGEQVERAIAHGWWDEVSTDLEAENYACGMAVLPACSAGAPHKRNRLWFVASNNRGMRRKGGEPREIQRVSALPWGEDVGGFEDVRNRSVLSQPLVRSLRDGVQDGVAILHAFGNAIVPQVAAAFIQSTKGLVW